MKIYNTLSRKKEGFTPIEDRKVRLYSCGPTVYDFAHIGNFRAYLAVDLLKRYLRYKGYDVRHVMNLTDVEDKIIKRAREEKRPFTEITDFYSKAFFKDLESLRIDKADEYPKATAHIEEIVKIIKGLLDQKKAYKGEDGSVYYDISSFKDYGKLSHTKIEGLKAGARVKQDDYAKEEAQDFALWKAWTEDDGDVYWETELGKGRPGWHIECSAMSMAQLGSHFDIHAGGIDLVFPHHENEIAQSEGFSGEPFANYWFHNEHLHVDGKKMSKSLGNFFTLRDLLERGHKPLAIRYFLISGHYRQQLNLTEKGLEGARNAVERINDFVYRLKTVTDSEDNADVSKKLEAAKRAFEEALDDDLNIPAALASFFDFMREMNALIDSHSLSQENAQQVLAFVGQVDSLLDVLEEEEETLDEEIEQLIEKREDARKSKDFQTADKIRDELKEKGIILEDSDQGVRWKRA